MRSSIILLLLSLLSLCSCQDIKKSRATYYDDAGPTGCGVDHAKFDTQYIVALNADGAYKGGRQCGRFLKATFGQACVGGNYDLTKGCLGKLVNDKTTGLSVVFQVQDACGADGSWCSNKDQWHIDMSVNTLAFIGKAKTNWDNRQVQWQFINNPHFVRIKIYYGQGGNPYWPKLVFTGLLNGITGVDRKLDGVWRAGRIIGINGLSYNFDTPKTNPKAFEIRIYDANGKLYPGTHTFQYPSSCGGQCTQDTLLTYTNFADSRTTTKHLKLAPKQYKNTKQAFYSLVSKPLQGLIQRLIQQKIHKYNSKPNMYRI